MRKKGFLSRLKSIFITKNDRMILKRLNEQIRILENDYVLYNKYNIIYKAENINTILKELKYIKTGKK